MITIRGAARFIATKKWSPRAMNQAVVGTTTKRAMSSMIVDRTAPRYHYSPSSSTTVGDGHRLYTTTTPLEDLSKYYRVEVSNAARPDATRIIVRGPDRDGILASMTVALALQGCSLKELHAGYSDLADTHSYEHRQVEGGQKYIEDIFFVAHHATNKPFADAELKDLGKSLLESLKTPMTTLSGKEEDDSDLEEELQHTEEEQITVIPGNAAK